MALRPSFRLSVHTTPLTQSRAKCDIAHRVGKRCVAFLNSARSSARTFLNICACNSVGARTFFTYMCVHGIAHFSSHSVELCVFGCVCQLSNLRTDELNAARPTICSLQRSTARSVCVRCAIRVPQPQSELALTGRRSSVAA